MDYAFIDWLIIGSLFLVTLSIGTSISFKDYQTVFRQPKALISGLFLQLFVLPATAFLIAYWSGLPPAFQVGLFIIACCPGGSNSNSVTFLVEGNTAVALSLTSINGFLTLVSIPLYVAFAIQFFMNQANEIALPFWDTMFQLSFVTVIPAFLGATINYYFPKIVEVRQKSLKRLTLILLLMVFIIKFFASKDYGGSGIETRELWMVLPFTLCLNILTPLIGFLIARNLKLPILDQMTLGIESGIQNTTLAFLIAGTLLQNQEMIKPALAYGIFTFWIGLAFGFWVKRQFNKELVPILSSLTETGIEEVRQSFQTDSNKRLTQR